MRTTMFFCVRVPVALLILANALLLIAAIYENSLWLTMMTAYCLGSYVQEWLCLTTAHPAPPAASSGPVACTRGG